MFAWVRFAGVGGSKQLVYELEYIFGIISTYTVPSMGMVHLPTFTIKNQPFM